MFSTFLSFEHNQPVTPHTPFTFTADTTFYTQALVSGLAYKPYYII